MNAELPLGTAARVVALAQAVAEEQHPQRRGQFAADARSSLERDLALDSLGRVELLGRLEGAFGIELPEQVLGSAETVQDLIAAVDGARPRGDAKLATVAVRTAPVAQVSAPLQALTLLQVLDHHAAATPDRVHARLLGENDAEAPLSYGELRAASNEVAAGLRARGLEAGATVVLMLPTSLEFFYAYFGVLRAGGVPVPIYPPARLAQIEEHLRRHAAILDNAQTGLLITVPEATRVARLMGAQARAGLDVVTIADLRMPPAAQPWPAVKPSDLAFIQYTSGSTGDPKGVMLTHANLLANIRAMGKPFAPDPAVDVFVSWLPLYHDMGLIGAWLGSLYFGLPLVVMSPLRFLAHPVRWLQAIHKYRGTITAAPNFGYELARSRSTDAELAGLDLRSLRIAANGAEAVLAATLRGFHERFAPFGLRPGTVRPVYGLAESSVGLAFPPQDREAPVDRIRRAPFLASGAAVPAAADEADAVEFVACGQPIPGHEIRVVDTAGREVPDRQEGAIQFRGPSSTQGYFRNPTATAALLDGTWLRTGDRGYLWNGDIVITGRAKDIIIRAGRNLYPAEIEAAVGAVPGIRRGCVAVFGAARTAKGTESLVVMAETRATDARAREALIKAATAAVVTVIGEPPDDVRLVPPHAVLKTSSGKIRRAANRERYERGDDLGARGVWLQFARLGATSARAAVARRVRAVGAVLYAAWWWTALAAVALFTWPVVTVALSRPFNRRYVRAAARVFLALVGARVTRTGGAVPDGGLVLAANHTSYFDVVALIAALPSDVVFVAKNTFERSALTGPFLRHLGTVFVERFDVQRGVADAAAIRDAVKAGARVVFFPEGTFTRMPGLLPFRSGAFATAAEAGVPVLPVAVRGVRTFLRAHSWFPRHARLTVAVGEAVRPEGNAWQAMVHLRDATRAQLLELSGEPDLKFETGAVERLRPTL